MLGGQSAQDVRWIPCPEVWQGMARAPAAELRLGVRVRVRVYPKPLKASGALRQGLLEGIAGVEARAYGLLADMGASPLIKVLRPCSTQGHASRRRSAGKAKDTLLPQADVADLSAQQGVACLSSTTSS